MNLRYRLILRQRLALWCGQRIKRWTTSSKS